tara:strand:- start:683 stop:1333 length:651 start_codon:yes stop_codon:yes gene_type:complete
MIEVTYQDHMGDDLATVNAARVSFGKTSKLVCTNLVLGLYDLAKGDRSLISFLAREKHFSPFGHSYAKFHVKAPIFVARQLVKHKFLRWNEISRRYVDDEPEFYVPEVWRGRAKDVKQGSTGEVKVPYLVPHEFNRSALYEYETLLEAGAAPEQARMVLPQSTMTEWIWSGSLDAFADMCRLRCAKDTQAETRIVADQVSNEMIKIFPVSWKALLA